MAARPAAAEDVQAWPGLLVSGAPRPGGVAVWGEAQLRFDDDVSRLLNKNLRVGIGREWEGGRSLYGGYAWFQTDQLGRSTTHEHRTWQQAGFPLLRRGPLRVTARLRLEQRFREEAADVAWRLRSQVRLVRRLGGEDAPGLVLQSELFTEFADTRWGVRARAYDQVRTFAGVNLPLSKKLSLDTGYQNQSYAGDERSGPNHIWLTQAAFRF